MRELDWKRATDLESQIKAVDDLMRGPAPGKSQKITAKQVLEPGTKSAAHQEALLFGATEYEHLARDLSDPEDRNARRDLLAEAKRLRNLADGK